MTVYEWLLLGGGVALLTLANHRFYFGNRSASYLFFILASALFVGGFLLAGMARGDYHAALTLMLIYLVVYVVERAGFIFLASLLRRRAAKGEKDEGEEGGQGGEEPGPD